MTVMESVGGPRVTHIAIRELPSAEGYKNTWDLVALLSDSTLYYSEELFDSVQAAHDWLRGKGNPCLTDSGYWAASSLPSQTLRNCAERGERLHFTPVGYWQSTTVKEG